MKMNYNIFLIFFLYFNVIQNTFSQVKSEKENISIQQVTIIKSYSPSLSNIFKIPETVKFLDSLFMKKKKIEYSVLPIPILSTFKPSKGEPQILNPEKVLLKYNSFFRAGFGNFNHMLIDYTSEIKLGRIQSINWLIKYDGLLKKIPNTVLSNSNSNSIFNISHSYHSNSLSSLSQINFHQLQQSFYGIRSNFLDPLIFEFIDPRQNLNYLSVGTRWNWFNSFTRSLDFKIFLTSDSYQSNEFEIDLKSKFQFSFIGFMVSLSPSFNHFSNEFASDYYSGSPSSLSSGKVGLGLNVSSSQKKIKFKIGAKSVYGLSDGFNEKQLYFFPYIDVLYNSSKRNFSPFINIKGDLILNNFRKFTHENQFTAPGIKIQSNEVPVEIRLGSKSLIAKGWEFIINGYYQINKNHPFYGNFGFDSTNLNFTSYRYGNSFEIIYDEIKIIGFETSIKANFKNSGFVNLNASYNELKTNNIDKPWNLPKLKLNFSGHIKIKSRLYAQWQLNYLGRRVNAYRAEFLLQDPINASILSEELKPFIYSNFKITYEINDKWNFFVDGENVFNQNYLEWSNYNSYGSQYLIGFQYNFDFNL